METIEFKEYSENLSNYLAASQELSILVISDKDYVLLGDGEFNLEYCRNKNLHILQTKHRGGTIINAAGDICIANFSNERHQLAENFMEVFMNFLLAKGLSASYCDNDLLIDNIYKVASFGIKRYQQKQERFYTGIHISMFVDNEVIKNVCTKTQVKIPKGLSEYGITVNEVKEFAMQFLNKMQNKEE